MNKFLKSILIHALSMLSAAKLIDFDPFTGAVGAKFAVNNDPNSMIGDFKNLYKTMGLVDAVPRYMQVQERFKFEEAEAGLGQFYIFGVILQKEQGFTYAPSSGANAGVQTLNAAVAGYIGQAQVQGYSIYLRSRLSYDAAAKASKAGKKAFAQAYGAVIKNMKESHQFRLECSLLYGQMGLGIVSTNTSGVLTLTAASWATGIWASGMSGATLEAWTTTAATSTQHNGTLVVGYVSVANLQVTVSGTNSSVVAGDILYFQGSRNSTGFNECAGLFAILANGTLNSAAVLFNIDASVYNLWSAQYYAVNGNLSLTAIMQAAAAGVNFGLEKGILFCNPVKFAQLASDEAALRRYIQDSPNAKRGVKGITFLMGAVEVEILPHPLVRQGHALLLAEDCVHRVGATDVTMSMPGSNEPMTVHVTDSTALEFRSMSDQGVYIETPAQCVLIDLIT
jgi:hypothetical protein